MLDSENSRTTLTRVRALALRAMEQAGGTAKPWQLRWALEPMLSPHLCTARPMPPDVQANVERGFPG